MVSTFLSYDLVSRDLKASMARVSSQVSVSREADYYKENIGKVTDVEDFLDDYRLYSFAMTANGLEDMIYAKAFMKKVLESDLSDEDSFANKLTDTRYKDFAASFNFSAATASAQSEAQEDDLIGLYKQGIVDEEDQVAADTSYYSANVDKVTTADQLLSNERLRTYVMDTFGIDKTYYSYSALKSVLTSDLDDPASYVNQLKDSSNKTKFLAMASYFSFNADGTITGATAQDAEQKASLMENYVLNVPSHVVPAAAQLNKDYYESKIATITNVSQLTSDSRLFAYVKTALQLDASVLTSTFKNIVTSDLSDPDNYATKIGGEAYEKIAKMFNFQTDGSVATGETAQSTADTASLASGYMSYYNDTDDAARETLYTYYTNNIGTVTNVKDLLANTKIYSTALAAFGIEAGEYSNSEMTKILTSDLSDPKSFANKQKDDRLDGLVRAFNFDTTGDITSPLYAQSEATIQDVSSSYIVQKTRFATGTEKTTLRTAADAESKYYLTQMTTIKTSAEFLADRRLVDFALVSKGIDPDTVTDDYMKKMFASDLDDPKSFANTEPDSRFAEIVASFNFDADGNVTRATENGVQGRGEVLETENNYLRQMLETDAGNDNAGTRLALYFERKSTTITDAYVILGDTALFEFFRTTFSMPEELANMDIDQQAKIVNQSLDLNDLKDPDKVKKLVQRFTVLYDLENSTETSGAVSILTGSGSSGIGADILESLASLKY